MRDPPSPTSVSTNLSVPEWVPVAVAVQAEDLHNSLVVLGDDFRHFAGAVCRLATNPLMQRVLEGTRPSQWRGGDFTRRLRAPRAGRRGSGRQVLLCPRASLSKGCLIAIGFSTRPWWISSRKPRTFFRGIDAGVGTTRKSVDDLRDLRLLASQLRGNAVTLYRLGGARFVQTLDRAAAYCDFQATADSAAVGPRTRTRAAVDADVRDLKLLATRLRDNAAKLSRLGGSHFVEELEKAADHCDLQAELRSPARVDPFLVARQSDRLGDPWVQGFIINTAECCRALFGKKMLGVVAIMANVAFERTDLTEDRIRGVFRRAPGVKMPGR